MSEILKTQTYKHLLKIELDDGRKLEFPYQLMADGEMWFANDVECDGKRVTAHIGDSTITDEIHIDGQLMHVTRSWSIEGDFEARAFFSVFCSMDVAGWCVPGVEYVRGDRAASAAEMRGPVQESHITTPCLSILQGKKHSMAVFTRPAGETDDLASVITHISDGHAGIDIGIPGESALDAGTRVSHGQESAVWPVSGQLNYERKFYIYIDSGPDFIQKSVDVAWDRITYEPELNIDWSSVIENNSKRIVEDYFIERSDAIGFVWKRGALGFASDPRLRTGVRGGNIEAAHVLYRVARKLENARLRQIALDTVDFFLSGEELQSLRFEYHPSKRNWRGPGSEISLNRQAGILIAEAVRMNRSATPMDNSSRWMFAAGRIASAVMDGLKPEETASGSEEEIETTRSWAYLIAAFTELHRETGESIYLETAEQLCGRLVSVLPDILFPRVAVLSPGSREAHIMLVSFLDLHSVSGRAEYLEAAVRTAQYIKTLTYSYRTSAPEKSALGVMGFNSTGGVLPAPGKGWLDPYAASIARDLLRLWKACGDDAWKTLAELMLEFVFKHTYIEDENLTAFMTEGRRCERFYHCAHPESSHNWGAISGDPCWIPVVTTAAVIDINEEFPEIIDINFKGMEIEIARESGIPRMMRYLGSYLNFLS